MNRRLKLELLSLATLAIGSAFAVKALADRAKRLPPHAQPLAAAALAGTALLLFRKTPRRDYFYKRSMLITGASRGLGLSLAAEALLRGANVTIISRDEEENARATQNIKRSVREKLSLIEGSTRRRLSPRKFASAHQLLDSLNNRILAVEADVTSPEEFARAADAASIRFGSVDTIINNAGSIVVGPIATMTKEDYEAQLKLHLYAPLESIRFLKQNCSVSRRGSLINISSIGAKIPVPHMSTYSTSKYALAGLSSVARSELKDQGIDVLTAYPGLMRTGSAIQAVFKGDLEKEFLWFAMSANSPIISKDADVSAREILDAAAAGQAEVIIGWSAKLGSFMYANFPEITHEILQVAARLQPRSANSHTAVGEEARVMFDEVVRHRALAAIRINEVESRKAQNQIAKHSADFNLGIERADGV